MANFKSRGESLSYRIEMKQCEDCVETTEQIGQLIIPSLSRERVGVVEEEPRPGFQDLQIFFYWNTYCLLGQLCLLHIIDIEWPREGIKGSARA